ncbi:MAG: CehA/McbA family metallohydrolase [Gemmatimonadetes bacterium]|nr:CehA/McbA family metallohydrolase [Gemmatimonadota bacterium]
MKLSPSRARLVLPVVILLLFATGWAVFDRTARKPVPPGQGDGGGTARIDPSAAVPAGSTGSWTITFQAGPDGIEPGGGLVVQFPVFWKWTPPQTESPGYPGFVFAEWSRDDLVLEAFASDLQWVRFTVRGERLEPGDRVAIHYGGSSDDGISEVRADPYAERGQEFLVKVDGDGDEVYEEIEESPRIDIIPGEAVQLRVFGRGGATVGDSTDLVVAALDRFGNLAPSYRGTIRFSHRRSVRGLPASYTFLEEDEGTRRFSFLIPEPGIFSVHAREEGGILEGRSNPIPVLPERGETVLLWADLHQHSNLSDGTGKPDDLYAYARDVANLDVMALTDHDHHGLRPLGVAPWEEVREATEASYEPGSFVTFLGYEWTNWTYGHRNVYYKAPDGEVFSMADSASNAPGELWNRLVETEAMTIAHHTGGGPVPIDWNVRPDPRFEYLVEIASVHGSSECAGCPSEIYRPVEGAFVQDALKRGYRLGFIGAGDGHIGHPGETYGLLGGLAGIYATERTRESVWEAMRARRTYATSGARIVLSARVGEYWMGEEFDFLDVDDAFDVSFEVVGTEPVDRVELIIDGRVADTKYCSTAEVSGSFTMRRPVTETWFYVRVIQMDGNLAWSSPFWITSKQKRAESP